MTQRLASLFRRLVEELAAAGGFDDVVEAVLREAGVPAGSDMVLLALPEPGGRRLRVSMGPHEAREVLSGWDGIAIDADHPLVEVLRLRRPVLLTTDTRRSQHPAAAALAELGMRSGALFSLGTTRGPLGVIGFLWRRRPRIDRSRRESLRIVAELCGLALERARLGMLEHELVSALRGEVLETPSILGGAVEVAGGYEPAWAGVPLGGDWFDAVETEAGRVAVAVGDVAGHGVRSAPEMIAVRQMLRILMADGADPAACLQELDGRVARRYDREGGTLISVMVGVIDPGAGMLTLANGGLPSPWIRAPGGGVRPMEAGRGRVVGAGLPDRVGRSASLPFGPGSVLLAHTDGLQGGRPEPPEALAAEIGEVLDSWGGGELGDLVGRLLGRDAGAGLRADDTVVLAARLAGPG